VGGLPCRVWAMYGPWLWPAKTALLLSREWISTAHSINHIGLTAGCYSSTALTLYAYATDHASMIKDEPQYSAECC